MFVWKTTQPEQHSHSLYKPNSKMATMGLNVVTIAILFLVNLQTCHGYCSYYGHCYGVWSMWYFWMSLVILLVICCGAIGGYWRRRRMMQAMNGQQGVITIQTGQGTANGGYIEGPPAPFMTPPPYNVATQEGAWPQPGKEDKSQGAPPSYFEAVPPGYQPHQSQPYPGTSVSSPYPPSAGIPAEQAPAYTPQPPPYPPASQPGQNEPSQQTSNPAMS